jgi:hypothetical protein
MLFGEPVAVYCENRTSQDTAVGIATGYGMDGQGSIPGRDRDFSLLHGVKTGSGVHPVSYAMGTGGCFPCGKAAGAWSWPLTSF